MQDAWRAYLEMALGLTEAPRKKAQRVAGDLVNRGGATAAQVQGLVEDLLSAGMSNREALTGIVRYEVDRALGAVGLATNDEVAELTTRVRDLEQQLREARSGAALSEPVPAGDRVERPAPLPGRAAKKTVAKKALKAPPNAMPAAATPGPAPKAVKAAATGWPAENAAPAGAPVGAQQPSAGTARKAAKKAPSSAEVTTAEATAVVEKAAKKAAAKKAAPARKAPARKAAAGTPVTPPEAHP